MGTKRTRNVIGPRVRHIRNEQGWTQERLAAKLQGAGWDISRVSLAFIEAQTRAVEDWELCVLAQVLKVPVSDLLPSAEKVRKLVPLVQLQRS